MDKEKIFAETVLVNHMIRNTHLGVRECRHCGIKEQHKREYSFIEHEQDCPVRLAQDILEIDGKSNG